MTSKENLEEQLHELSDAIGSDEKLVENVLNRTYSAPATDDVGAGNIRRIIMKPSWMKLAAAAGIAVVFWIAVSYFGGSTNSASKVYAAMLEALHDVNTVHVSGWTTRIQPYHTAVGGKLLDTSKQYPIDIWEWFTEDGAYRMFERQGPITIWHEGDLRYEYRADKDTLYIDKDKSSPRFSIKFGSFVMEIESLIKRGVKVILPADRMIDDRKATGYRVYRDGRREDIWFDTQTDLLLEISEFLRTEGQWKQWRFGVCAYDQDIPAHIRAYVPPKAKRVEYGSDIDPKFKEYHSRLLEISAHYQQHPLPEAMELLPRDNGRKLDDWYLPGRLSGITDTTGYWVLPVQSSLADFLRSRIKPYGSLRVPDELQNIQLNHDLITKNDHTSRDRVDFVLDALGFEIVEIREQRKVWIAHYDGRPLRPWREVKAPVARGDARHTKPGMDWNFNAHTMKNLLDSFAYYQDYDLGADRIMIIDETGLPSEPAEGQSEESIAVSSASPYWRGDESIEMARKWFREQFGVTFTEEIRPMIVHVVRKRGH
jgi:hypothetical protein